MNQFAPLGSELKAGYNRWMVPFELPLPVPACDWAALRSADRDYWAAEFARAGPETSFRASVALWRHMRSVRADWPTTAEREADLRHHVEVQRLLARVARVAAR